MSNIYTSADQLIGKTPLLELVHIEKSEGLEAKILGKLEYFNPAAPSRTVWPRPWWMMRRPRACSSPAA